MALLDRISRASADSACFAGANRNSFQPVCADLPKQGNLVLSRFARSGLIRRAPNFRAANGAHLK
jgi:hypothetical protein